MARSLYLLSASPEHLQPALDLLRKQGVSVQRVEGAFRLAAEFGSKPADVVVIDLEGLRRQDLDLLAVLRERRPEVGVVILAEPEQHDLAGLALCRGADLYLLKPVQGLELVEAVDRALMRRRLAEAEQGGTARLQTLSEFALGVAHEVNNPLTTISGWLQMLSADRASDEQLVSILRTMKEEADRIAEVVRQLLVFAQQGPPRMAPVDLGGLLAELGRVYGARCKEKGIEVVTHISPDLPPVAGDEAQLRQACDVILSQAEAALDGGGRIEVTCRPAAEGVEVVFQDNGPRIPPEVLARIFEPFSAGRRGDGRGPGLCVAYGIVRSHGGRIEAESGETAGSRFTVWLPSSAIHDTAKN